MELDQVNLVLKAEFVILVDALYKTFVNLVKYNFSW